MEAHCDLDGLKVRGGDGSKSNPFIIRAFNYTSSASAQKNAISAVYGEGQWTFVGRNYYESPNGKPANKDLCEWVIAVGGINISVWFDLYMVTRYQEDPKWIAERQKIFGPPSPRIMNAITAELAQRVHIVVDKSPNDLELVEKSRCISGANLPERHPLKPVLRASGKVPKVIFNILKWCCYLVITVWACATYGWVGLFAIPLVKAAADFLKAVDNWTDYWSKAPRNKP